MSDSAALGFPVTIRFSITESADKRASLVISDDVVLRVADPLALAKDSPLPVSVFEL